MRNTLFTAALLTIALACGLFCGCNKINIPGNIGGQILNAAGQGQGYLSVECIDATSGAIVQKVIAEDSGNFFFDKLAPGTYKLKVLNMGQVELATDAEPEIVLSPGKTLSLTLTLQ